MIKIVSVSILKLLVLLAFHFQSVSEEELFKVKTISGRILNDNDQLQRLKAIAHWPINRVFQHDFKKVDVELSFKNFDPLENKNYRSISLKG